MCNLMMYETIAISFHSFGLAQQVFIFSKSHKLYIFYDLANLHIVWKSLKMYHLKTLQAKFIRKFVWIFVPKIYKVCPFSARKF